VEDRHIGLETIAEVIALGIAATLLSSVVQELMVFKRRAIGRRMPVTTVPTQEEAPCMFLNQTLLVTKMVPRR
jgi:hypothetical protein